LYTGQEVGKTGTTPFFTNSTINWTANADMLASYQKLYTIYNQNSAARRNNISSYQLSNDLICWKKTNGASSMLILENVRNSTINITLPPALTGNFTNLVSGENENITTSMSLPAYAYRIYRPN
jgi:hypothetical protein